MATRTNEPGVVPDWTLGWRMQRALDFGHMKVQDMADELGVSRQTVSRWMSDKGTPPRRIYVQQWALRCGVPYEWLINGEVSQSPHPEGDGPVAQSSCTLLLPLAGVNQRRFTRERGTLPMVQAAAA
jgi:transcriptional regulator with XRE-family HTH domain